MDIKKVVANGTEFNYIEHGQGSPVILVHGSLNDYRAWGPQMETFSRRYNVIAYSRRYHYPNPWVGDGKDYSASLHSNDLAALIDALGLGPVGIISHSYGAYASLLLSAGHSELVRALVIGEPPLIPWLEDIPDGSSLGLDFINNVWKPSDQAFQSGDLELGVRIFIDGVSGKGTFSRLPPPVRDMIMDNAPAMAAQTSAQDQFPSFTCQDAGRIKAPALVLTGQMSPKWLQQISYELKRCISQSALSVIPDASHNMQSGNPKAFNETVLSFLEKNLP